MDETVAPGGVKHAVPQWWRAIAWSALLVIGAALLYLPYKTQRELDRWRVELRERGHPAQAHVYYYEEKRRGRRLSQAMFVTYDIRGRSHQQEVPCYSACLSAGQAMSIFVNPDDPSDFVTEYRELSGNRGRVQGVLGAVGFSAMLLAALALILPAVPSRDRRRRRPATGRDRSAPFVPPRSKHKRRSRG